MIPDKNLEETFENAGRRYPWIQKYTDRSITEIEMLYGSLFYPEYSGSSLFYLRDASYANGKPDWRASTDSPEEKKVWEVLIGKKEMKGREKSEGRRKGGGVRVRDEERARDEEGEG